MNEFVKKFLTLMIYLLLLALVFWGFLAVIDKIAQHILSN